MSNERQLVLSEITETIQTGPFGSQLHQSDYSEIGTPVVMPKDLIGGAISEASIARVSADHVTRLSRHKMMPGDIVYSRRGDVGRCALVTSKEQGWLCGTGCLRVTIDPNKANPKYVFYYLQLPKTIAWVENHAVGATMLNLNTSILGNIPIRLPDIRIQNKVVSIISSYDDQIVTNKKQIDLLEEAAQRTYKEWFVNFRFPGYEETTFDNGIPIEWHYGELGEVAQFRRGKTITKDDAIAGDVPVIAGGLTPAYYHNQSNTSAPVVTVSGSGANAGFTRMYHIRVWASDCSFIDSFSTKSIYFVYCYLKANKQSIDNLQKGSAQPHVYAKDLNQLRTLIPSLDIVESFHELVKPLFDRIATLEKQVLLLTEARERVLPQLI